MEGEGLTLTAGILPASLVRRSCLISDVHDSVSGADQSSDYTSEAPAPWYSVFGLNILSQTKNTE